MRQGDDLCERKERFSLPNISHSLPLPASASSLPVNQYRRRRSPSPVESSHRSNPHRNRNDRSLSLSPRYSPYPDSSIRSFAHQKEPYPSPTLLRLPRPPIPLRPSLSSSQLPLVYPDLVRIYLPLSKGTNARYLTSYFFNILNLAIYNLALLVDYAPSYAFFDIERTTWEDGTLNKRISEVEEQGRDLFKDNQGKVWYLRPRLAVPPRVNHDDRGEWNHRSRSSESVEEERTNGSYSRDSLRGGGEKKKRKREDIRDERYEESDERDRDDEDHRRRRRRREHGHESESRSPSRSRSRSRSRRRNHRDRRNRSRARGGGRAYDGESERLERDSRGRRRSRNERRFNSRSPHRRPRSRSRSPDRPSRQSRRHRRSHNDRSRSPSDYRQSPSQSPESSPLPPPPSVVPDYYNHLSTHAEGGQIPQYSYPYTSKQSAPFDFHNQRRDFPSPSRTIASDQPSFYRGLIDFDPSQFQQPWPQQAWDQPPRQQPSTQLWSNRTYETHPQNYPPPHHRDLTRYHNDDQQSRVGGWSAGGWRQIDQNELERERIEREREWEYWDAANGRYRNGSYRR